MVRRKKTAKTYDLRKFLNVEKPETESNKISMSNSEKKGNSKVKKRKFKFKLSSFLLLMFVMYVVIILGTQQVRLFGFEKDISSVNKEIEQAEQQQQELLEQMELMKQDEYIERVAREKLGLIKPGEIPYIAVPTDEDADVRIIDRDTTIIEVED